MNKNDFTLIKLFIVLALSCVLSLQVFSADWTSWRGPNANGISNEHGWNPKALDNPDVVWNINIGKGHSTVAIKGNYLYTMGNKALTTGSRPVHEDTVFCIDNRTGKEVWRYSYPCREGRWPGPRTTPVVDGPYVYTLSQEGHLFCFNALNGMVKWKRHLVSDGLSKLSEWGFSTSPVIEGNMLILNAGKSGITFNKKTGKIIWKSEPEKGGLAVPVLFDFNNQRLAAIIGSNTLHAVDIKTGKVQWSYKWNAYADPIVYDNFVYLTGGLSRTKRGCVLLKMKEGEPEEVWHNKKANYSFQSWVILNGFAYGFRRANKEFLLCVDLKTGDVKWEKDMGNWGSLIASNGKLIVIAGDGDLIIAEASPEAFKVISSAKILRMKNWRSYPENAPNACWSAPVLSNGRVYARNTYGDVICVNVN